MKLICMDRDNCGFYCKIDYSDDSSDNICPDCFGLAIEVSDNHIPLHYLLDNEEDCKRALALLATFHNLLSPED